MSPGKHGARKQTLRMNENNITHNNPTSPLSARLPAHSISLTTKTVSPDLTSDVHSKLDTSVWLSITTELFGMPAAPSFSPIHNSVKGEQFRCYKSPKGERASERLTGCTVAEGDLQHPATVFFILQGHPASLTWAIPTSVSLFFLLNFPFLWGFFSLALCVWLRGLYPISFTSFFFIRSSYAPIEFVLFG